MARRSAFIAAATLAAACDRCGEKPRVCLQVQVLEEDASPPIHPVVCLSMSIHLPDEDAGSAEAGKEGGAITLTPIDITGDGGSRPIARPCLSVVVPTPTPTPTPKVCLRRME